MRRQQTAVSLVGVPRELTEHDAAAIIEMARDWAALVGEMRRALEAGDEAAALDLARRVAGLERVTKQ